MQLQLEERVRDTLALERKGVVMCYEFSNWSWKLRAAELARKEGDAANAAKTQGEPVTPAQPAAPQTRVDERESVPA
jgi:hypothetical protein